jgi:hypothetical protein
VTKLKSKFRRKFKAPSSKSKLGLIAIGFIFVIGIAGYLLIPVAISQSADNDMNMGDVNCSVGLTTTPLYGGNPVRESTMNSQFYVGGSPVDALQFNLQITSDGSYVDWSTLSISIDLTVNDASLKSWTVGTDLAREAGGLSESVSHTVTELDYLAGSTPDKIQDNGVEIYYLNCEADVVGSITDVKGNTLEDTLLVTNRWELQTDPDGVFSIDSDAVTKPSFTQTPADASITQGDSYPITWSATDDNPTTYQIATYTPADGSTVQKNGEWSNTTAMTYDPGTFVSIEPGDYSLRVTCRIEDDDGHTVTDSVVFQVTVPAEPDAPIFEKSDGPSSVDAGTEALITFKPRSDNPDSYEIYLNGVEVKSGSWSGGDIGYGIKSVEAGDNYVKCVVHDTYGQSNDYTHTVTGVTMDDQTTDENTDESKELMSPFGVISPPIMSLAIALAAIPLGAILWWRERE